jgi:hypothetical protein
MPIKSRTLLPGRVSFPPGTIPYWHLHKLLSLRSYSIDTKPVEHCYALWIAHQGSRLVFFCASTPCQHYRRVYPYSKDEHNLKMVEKVISEAVETHVLTFLIPLHKISHCFAFGWVKDDRGGGAHLSARELETKVKAVQYSYCSTYSQYIFCMSEKNESWSCGTKKKGFWE